jgi:hypothetical protein
MSAGLPPVQAVRLRPLVWKREEDAHKASWAVRTKSIDLPGQIRSRVNDRLDRNQGGHGYGGYSVDGCTPYAGWLYMSVCERYGDAYLFKHPRHLTHLFSHNMPNYPTIDSPYKSAQDSKSAQTTVR